VLAVKSLFGIVSGELFWTAYVIVSFVEPQVAVSTAPHRAAV
jgi:hypothetical protein